MRRFRLIRFLSITLLLVGQGTMAFAGAGDVVPDRATNMIVICSPNGLKLIAWNVDADAPGKAISAPLCPLCIAAADMPAPAPGAISARAVQYEPYAPPSWAQVAAVGDASPNPARAPPV